LLPRSRWFRFYLKMSRKGSIRLKIWYQKLLILF